jgi:hypothetical protein
VRHQDKTKLEIHISGSSSSLGFSKFVQNMTNCMQEQIVDKDLREWVIPNFTTTTETDIVVASVAFMGAMSAYFDYGGRTGCGLPSVTLMGEQKDWEVILEKLEKVKTLGDEPTQWYVHLLSPCFT